MFARGLLIALIFLLPIHALAVELRDLSIEIRKYPGKTYFAQLPDETVREEVAVIFDIQLAGCLYWWNRIHGSSTDSQFRWIGWNHALSCRLEKLELFYEHHSEHALDRTRPEHFPVNDSVGLLWKVYARP